MKKNEALRTIDNRQAEEFCQPLTGFPTKAIESKAIQSTDEGFEGISRPSAGARGKVSAIFHETFHPWTTPRRWELAVRARKSFGEDRSPTHKARPLRTRC
jgi:hypothetical protein